MEQVIETLKRRDAEERIPVLKLEIDYELVTLHDALIQNCMDEIANCKVRLEKFRQELIRLEV
ncbi:hypothetical protein [Sinobaca sp. H24]|uniref:hypothetical protein n=1 Tax=Sinobaca sp. H24 TaxID=2923376 RepID=UPI00207AB936|nr:hypothetical protein [Sinobaca sp. H24]